MIHSTPHEATSSRVIETVFIEKKTFLIERPSGLDKVFDHPAVRSAYAKDEYIPYWADLWASARMLAKAILREPWSKYSDRFGKPLAALEVGCGLGLVGVAALARGLRVTFSDCDEAAVMFAGNNATLNGYAVFTLKPMDLRDPPSDLAFPVILGSDLMYEERLVEPLVQFIDRVLMPGGVALIADPDRMAAKSFRWRVQNAGLTVEVSPLRAGEPGGERIKGTLYRITHQEPPR